MERVSVQISIILLSYCHEKYIRQALESIFNQQTCLCYEVLVGDDASKDGTADIIREYAELYPNIKPTFRKENVGASYTMPLS